MNRLIISSMLLITSAGFFSSCSKDKEETTSTPPLSFKLNGQLRSCETVTVTSSTFDNTKWLVAGIVSGSADTINLSITKNQTDSFALNSIVLRRPVAIYYSDGTRISYVTINNSSRLAGSFSSRVVNFYSADDSLRITEGRFDIPR